MATPKEARAEIGAVLGSLLGIRYSADLTKIDPPALVVGLPRLRWTAICVDPTSATFLVYLIVPLSDRSVEQLQDLLPTVVEALEMVTDASVTEALPLVSPYGGPDLPAYEIAVDVAL